MLTLSFNVNETQQRIGVTLAHQEMSLQSLNRPHRIEFYHLTISSTESACYYSSCSLRSAIALYYLESACALGMSRVAG